MIQCSSVKIYTYPSILNTHPPLVVLGPRVMPLRRRHHHPRLAHSGNYGGSATIINTLVSIISNSAYTLSQGGYSGMTYTTLVFYHIVQV